MTNQPIRVVHMEEEVYLFLLHVLETYAQRGMPLKQLAVAAELTERVVAAQTLNTDLGNATVEPTATGIALEIQTEH